MLKHSTWDLQVKHERDSKEVVHIHEDQLLRINDQDLMMLVYPQDSLGMIAILLDMIDRDQRELDQRYQ